MQSIKPFTSYFSTCGPNLVILAWMGHVIDTRTDTDTQMQATTIPDGQNWPLVIKWTQSGAFLCGVCWDKTYQHLLWYMRLLKCSGLAFILSKRFINLVPYIYMQLFWHLPSCSGGWMKKQGFRGIYVVRHQRRIGGGNITSLKTISEISIQIQVFS